MTSTSRRARTSTTATAISASSPAIVTRRPVKWGARDYSACRVANTKSSLSCSFNTAYTPYGRLDVSSGPTPAAATMLTRTARRVSSRTPTALITPATPARTGTSSRADKRYTGGLFANYRFSDAAEVYGNLLVMRDVSIEQQSGAFGATVNVNCNIRSCLLPRRTALRLGGWHRHHGQRRLLHAAGRPRSIPVQNRIVNADYRFSGGLRGDVFDGWHYDVNFVASRVENFPV